MMLLLFYLVILAFDRQMTDGKNLHDCQFARTFYRNHRQVFELNKDQTSLTVRPLYALTNQSFSSNNQSLTMGIIYRFATTYLVPVPLLFQCSETDQIYAPKDCEFTILDTRPDSSIRTSESTRTATVPLHFRAYSSSTALPPLRGAYFKQSTIALRNCRLHSNETLHTSDIFHLRIEFEQTIGSKCSGKCSHSQLYECSSLSNSCQCRSDTIERIGHLCVDTELTSNCSLSPERCRRLCHIHTDQIDHHCQCPLGTRRVFSNEIYHCQSPRLAECDANLLITTCPRDNICRDNRRVPRSLALRVNASVLHVPLILLGLLIGALFIIILLIMGLCKMRSIKCVKFVHPPNVLSTHSGNSSPATITRLSTVHSSSSPCSTLSSSSKSVQLSSTNHILEKYTKIEIFE